jgi:hypothetical protein
VIGLRLLSGALALACATGVLSACGSDSESSGTDCDRSAIAAAVSEQAGGDAPARLDEDGYGCAGDWAYAYADVGTGEEEVTVTVVLRLSDGRWRVQDRATVCRAPGDQVPEEIYDEACESN